MPRKASADLDLVGKAVEYLKKHPTLSTAEAMKLAGFSEEETKNRSAQKLVRCKLPDKSKTNQVSFASGSTVDGEGGFVISYKPIGAAPRGWPGETVKRCFYVFLVWCMVW